MTEFTTAHPLRVGVQFHPQHTTYASFADAVRRVEDGELTQFGTGITSSHCTESRKEITLKAGHCLLRWQRLLIGLK